LVCVVVVWNVWKTSIGKAGIREKRGAKTLAVIWREELLSPFKFELREYPLTQNIFEKPVH